MNLALKAYEDSKGWHQVVRRTQGKEPKSVSTFNPGNQKYLMTMARLMEMQAKLAAPRLGRFFVADPLTSADEEQYPTFAAAALQMTAAEEAAVRQRYLEHLAAEKIHQQAAAAAKAE